MKKILILYGFILLNAMAYAQTYGNEWINFNQDYYKIKIGKEGIYKLNYSTLNAIGFPVSSVNPKNIQLFINGQEQPILVTGEADSKFDNTDYIEFYGTYNDGKLDAPLYPNASEQPHQYMSLYSDTATYFLTVSATIAGKRVAVNNDTNYAGKTADPYFMYEQVNWYDAKKGGSFWDGYGFSAEGFHSEYTEGEGWSLTSSGGGSSITFSTPYLSSIGPNPYIEVLAHPRGNNVSAYDLDGFNNGLELSFQPSGKVIEQKRVKGLSRYLFQDSINDRSLIGNSNTSFKTLSYLLAKTTHSVSYFKLIYPRLFSLGDSSTLKFQYASTNNFIKFSSYSTSKSNPIIYDFNNHTKSIAKAVNGDLFCNISSAGFNKTL